MSWSAKPSGAYGFGTEEGVGNVGQMNAYFNTRGYTLESQSGIIGNANAESGLNPWRWESDVYNQKRGYGLFQFTPGSGYIINCRNLTGYGPNLSVTTTTAMAKRSDGLAQCAAFDQNVLGKWVSTCWRSYWDPATYPDLYALHQEILDLWGNGSSLSMAQFRMIDNIRDATFAFLACFEGPSVPNMDTRLDFARTAYTLITGETPPPDPPDPGYRSGKMPLWMYLKPF